jgi:hypothetical protein
MLPLDSRHTQVLALNLSPIVHANKLRVILNDGIAVRAGTGSY